MKYFLLILTAIWSSNCHAIAQYNKTTEYYIVFCGKKATAGSAVGHAFVSLGKGDPFTSHIDGPVTELWGLYATTGGEDCIPSHIAAAASYFVGEVPGCLVSDVYTQADNYFELRLSFEEYLLAEAEIDTWKRKDYQLTQQDCLTFVMNMASLFSERVIILERNGYENFPYLYIKELIKENKGK